MMSRPLYDSYRTGPADPPSATESCRGLKKQLTATSKGKASGGIYGQKSEGIGVNAIVVDVMHAGVDTQDFVDLSENGTSNQQEIIMIDRDTDMLIG